MDNTSGTEIEVVPAAHSAGIKRKTPERRRSNSINAQSKCSTEPKGNMSGNSSIGARPIPLQEAFVPFSEKKKLPKSDFSAGVPPTPFKRNPSEDVSHRLLKTILFYFPPTQGQEWERIKETRTSKIYKIIHKETLKPYILKKLNPRLIQTREDQAQAKREYYYGNTLSYFHLVKYYECWCYHSNLYFRIEYCELGSLENYLQYNSVAGQGDSYEKKELWHFFLDLLLGLYYLHCRKVVHLDLKPGNIFVVANELQQECSIPRLKIGDFGNMQPCNQSAILKDGGGDGRYLPPEILKINEYDHTSLPVGNIDTRCDIYSLGLTVYEMATNFYIDNNTNEHIMAGRLEGLNKMSPQLREIVPSMLHSDYQRRPNTIDILTKSRPLVQLRERLGIELPHSNENDITFQILNDTPDFGADENFLAKKKKSEGQFHPIRKKLF